MALPVAWLRPGSAPFAAPRKAASLVLTWMSADCLPASPLPPEQRSEQTPPPKPPHTAEARLGSRNPSLPNPVSREQESLTVAGLPKVSIC